MDKINNLDLLISNHIYALRTNQLSILFKAITILGSWYIIIPLIFIAILLSTKHKQLILTPIFTSLSFITNRLLKLIFHRARPDIIFALVSESFYSFPSAHAMVSTTFYGSLIYIICKRISNKWLKSLISILFSLLILLIGFSRIYLGVHYFTDVIIGTILGLIPIFFLPKIYKNINSTKKTSN